MTSFPCLVWSWDPAVGQSVWRISLQPSHPPSPNADVKVCPAVCPLACRGSSYCPPNKCTNTRDRELHVHCDKWNHRQRKWVEVPNKGFYSVFKCFWVQRTSLRPDYSWGRAYPLRNPVSVGQTHLQPWYSHYLKLLNKTANNDCFHYSQIISQ